MNNMLLGVIAALSFVAVLFFLKFWKASKDRFFLYFAGAFAIETISRIGQALAHSSLEDSLQDFPTFYLMRLSAFGLILIAILTKNRTK